VVLGWVVAERGGEGGGEGVRTLVVDVDFGVYMCR
jgi:hypothetical protein